MCLHRAHIHSVSIIFVPHSFLLPKLFMTPKSFILHSVFWAFDVERTEVWGLESTTKALAENEAHQ